MIQLHHLFKAWQGTVHVLPPRVITAAFGHPRPLLNINNIVAKACYICSHFSLQRIGDGENRDDGKDADGDAEQREKGAKLVYPQGFESEEEAFAKEF